MESVSRLARFARMADKDAQKEERAREARRLDILSEIKEVSRQLLCNDLWFEMESREDLIDACIYQREALRARYRYLLGLARREGVENECRLPVRARA